MDIDATPGVRRIEFGGARKPAAPGVRSSQAGQFAQVYELADARRKRITGPDTIPQEVWEDMSRANELAEDLAADDRAVRFDTHRLTGRVVASLTESDGTVVRSMSLPEVLGIDPDPTPAA
jgi:hypothetical protein